MKSLGNTERVVAEDKNGENVPKFKMVDVVFMHCIIVNNNYQQTSKVLFTFVPNKDFGQLIAISPHLY